VYHFAAFGLERRDNPKMLKEHGRGVKWRKKRKSVLLRKVFILFYNDK